MKKITTLLILLLGISATLLAQTSKKPITVKINTPSAACEECKTRIESFMKYEPGIAKVVVDFKKKVTTISYLPDRTNIENVKTAIANVGFDADDIKANPDTYKKLPICCKRVEDGGGPPKKQ
jgi:periplasmic mercuric ion binding protein